ncbi:glycerophosphodiester phosphodiesterase [Actinotalea sp.]|uniref:glycerophosphodiester phosphodiesterase n=1 Tax=Actinotalea sp. TaxID=1872145 RepID=UPI00356A0FF5
MGYFDLGAPIALAHRGFSLDGLENSMVAFQAAVDLGYRYVETDVHATSDGVAVAFHDSSLDRVTDRSGSIAKMPWSQVRRARIGGSEPVPTLAEVLHTWPRLKVNIDVKSAAAIGPTIDVIERESAHERVCLTSFSDARRLATLRGLSRPVATSGGTGVVRRFVLGSLTGARGRARKAISEVGGLQVPESAGPLRVVSSRTIAAAHAAGVQVHVWTVNDPADMHRLLDLGVDGLVSDRADLLREVLVERDEWVEG